jgi:WD40 repeat protein
MGRPERPLDPDDGALQSFAHELRRLRDSAGRPSYRELARKAHYSITALSQAAAGEIRPSLAVTLAYVQACGGDVGEWEARWKALADEVEPAYVAEQDLSRAPYLGLVTFQPDDADRFFGRQQLIGELCSRLAEEPFLALFGVSGSGKSSLLRAGLLPTLAKEVLPGSATWPSTLFTPGESPVEQLAISLANIQGISATSLHADLMADPANVSLAIRQALAGKPKTARLAIVVDQFEEVFTMCREEKERAAFIDCLTSAVERIPDQVRVVLGVRADFYGKCADYPALVAALRDRQLLVGPMDEDDLRAVVLGPAMGAGLKVEAALVQEIIGEARTEPGALPLMSHCLLETWKRRKGETLTLAGYRAAGGIQGCIAQTADWIYDGFDLTTRQVTKQILLRLVTLGDGTEDTRRRVARTELLAGPDGTTAVDVVDRLTATRLVTVDEDSVQVAHEALIKGWPRLRRWLVDDRELIRLHRQITHAATEWDQAGRDAALLYRGSRLAMWDSFDRIPLNDLEWTFLEASRDNVRQEQAALRMLTALAVGQANRAHAERDVALSRQLAAEARRQLLLDPELGLLLAKHAFEVRPTTEAESVLRQAVVDLRVRCTVAVDAGKVCGVALAPDGRYVATSSGDGSIRVWEMDSSGKPTPHSALNRLKSEALSRCHVGEAWSPVFSPDGSCLATAGLDGTIRIWAWTRDSAVVLRGHQGPVWGVAFSPDGCQLASAGADGTVRIWSAVNAELAPLVLSGHEGRALNVVFSPDGQRLISCGGDGTVRIWNTNGDGDPSILRDHYDAVRQVAVSPDGCLLASAGNDGVVRIWDLLQEDLRAHRPLVLRGHEHTVEGVAFSPDGLRIASAGNDGTIRIWNARSDVDPLVLRGHHGPVWSVAFTPDGRRLVSGSDDGTVRIWDATAVGDPDVRRGHIGPVWEVAASVDGRRLVSGGKDGTVRIWEPADPASPQVLVGHQSDVHGVAFAPDGRSVASSGDDGTVRIWPADRAGEPVVLRGHTGLVFSVAFPPAGYGLASASNDGTVRVWNNSGDGEPTVLRGPSKVRYVAYSPDGRWLSGSGDDGTVWIWPADRRGEPVVLHGHTGLVYNLTFSADSRWLASGGNDGTVRIWNVHDMTETAVLRGHQGIVWCVAFSPDGRYVASAGNDNTVRLWQVGGVGEPVVYRGHGASTEALRFDPRHSSQEYGLVTSHGDGTIRIWRWNVGGSITSVLSLAEQRMTRELTVEERRKYLP